MHFDNDLIFLIRLIYLLILQNLNRLVFIRLKRVLQSACYQTKTFGSIEV
jgi:hypothetical protein